MKTRQFFFIQVFTKFPSFRADFVHFLVTCQASSYLALLARTFGYRSFDPCNCLRPLPWTTCCCQSVYFQESRAGIEDWRGISAKDERGDVHTAENITKTTFDMLHEDNKSTNFWYLSFSGYWKMLPLLFKPLYAGLRVRLYGWKIYHSCLTLVHNFFLVTSIGKWDHVWNKCHPKFAMKELHTAFGLLVQLGKELNKHKRLHSGKTLKISHFCAFCFTKFGSKIKEPKI